MSSNGKKTRAFRQSTSSDLNIDQPNNSAAHLPPAPYRKVSACLNPFLVGLNTSHIYIVHIDNQPRDFKRKIFLVPLLLNSLIVLLLLWRIKSIAPWYFQISQSLWIMSNETTASSTQRSFRNLFFEVIFRARVFLTDYILFVLISSWPREFFAGSSHGSPLLWRLGVGFRDREIIVRKSRGWYVKSGDLNGIDPNEEKIMNDFIKKAIDPIWLHEKTGYLMLNKEWNLDWNSMCIATELVNKKSTAMEDFQVTVLLHDDNFGWMALNTPVSKNDGILQDENSERRKIVAIKEQLHALGKEDLFYKWIELVHFESSKPGGFGPELQQNVMIKAKALFKSQDVDFEGLWASVNCDGLNEISESSSR